ncbi:MAG: serine/threonine protein kinase, partial [Gemmatimonadota bacterium]|nr:serine/threonine protein kinase [Gemmatimonadota bacterium]
FEEIILACLEKDPDRRPQSANHLDASLAACDPDETWTPQRAGAWWDLHHPTPVLGEESAERLLRVV